MARKQRIPLSRSRIAEAALELICNDGLSGLSMRKVGASLGVEAMSLYRHVAHREDLLDAVHELILAEVQRHEATNDWVEDAMQLGRGLRDVLLRRPRAVVVVATRPAVAGASVDLLEFALSRVRPHVADVQQAIAVVQTLFAFVIGHCTFHAALAGADGAVAIDPLRHPCLSEAATNVSGSISADAEFDVGIAVFAAGLRSRFG